MRVWKENDFVYIICVGYVVQGSNGEYVSLTFQEKVDTVKFVREETSKDKLILAGSGCEGKR